MRKGPPCYPVGVQCHSAPRETHSSRTVPGPLKHGNNELSGKTKVLEEHHVHSEGEHLRNTYLVSSDRFSVQRPCHGDATRVLIDSENSFRLLIHSLSSEPEPGPFRPITIDYLVRETERHLRLWLENTEESTFSPQFCDQSPNHRCQHRAAG